ncbi:hypothetical protein N185_01280 [Sinorhizobium sp. GW3]|nr:hypothetical protein N185_01280 [Sinorhizobium sp. GW3]
MPQTSPFVVLEFARALIGPRVRRRLCCVERRWRLWFWMLGSSASMAEGLELLLETRCL